MSVRRPCLLALAILASCSRPPAPEPTPAPSPPSPALEAGTRDDPPGAAASTEGAGPIAAPGGAAATGAPAATAGEPTPAAPAKPGPVTALALVREAAVLPATGDPVPLAAEGETVVEPDARFRVELREASHDARLLLLNAADAAVPSTASHEIGDLTHLTLSPTEPLVPGSRYTLRLDGAVGRELHAGDRAYLPGLYPLRVAGEPPPPPPPRKKGKKARR